MPLRGDFRFAAAAVLMARDFRIGPHPLYPRLAERVPGARMMVNS
jgi:hypothetical protein